MPTRASSSAARQPCVLRCSTVAMRSRLYELIVEDLSRAPSLLQWQFVKRRQPIRGTRDYLPIKVLPAGAERIALLVERVGAQVCVSMAGNVDGSLTQKDYADLIRFSFEPIQDVLHERLNERVGRLVLFCPLGSTESAAKAPTRARKAAA